MEEEKEYSKEFELHGASLEETRTELISTYYKASISVFGVLFVLSVHLFYTTLVSNDLNSIWLLRWCCALLAVGITFDLVELLQGIKNNQREAEEISKDEPEPQVYRRADGTWWEWLSLPDKMAIPCKLAGLICFIAFIFVQ